MIAGHYALALALRSRKKSPGLGWLFAAVSFADILCYSLILAGIEDFEITPGFTAYFPFRLVNAWVSHGLLGTAAVSLVIALLFRFFARDAALRAGAWVLGLAVFSHFPLDWLVHGPDMPLTSGTGKLVGAGLWNIPVVSVSLELAMLAGGCWCLAKRGDFRPARAKKITFYLLIAWIAQMTIFLPYMPHPDGKALVAITAGGTLILVVLIAAWIDSARALLSSET